MSEYGEVAGSLDAKAEQAVERKTEAVREKMTRAEAVEIGRRLGAGEAASRGETSDTKEQRIRRAQAYAAWEYDGRPVSSQAQRIEFEVSHSEVAGSLERAPFVRLLRKEKKT